MHFILLLGAHAIGQTEIDLNAFDCDYYVSNLHKWFCAPKGCSFLYLKDKERLEINLEPNYISHGYKKDLSYNFFQSKLIYSFVTFQTVKGYRLTPKTDTFEVHQ